MRRAAIALSILALVCAAASAQSVGCSTGVTSTSTIACTMSGGNAVTAGGTLILMSTPFLTNFSTSSVTFVSATDTFSLSWTKLYDVGGRQISCAPVGANSGSDTITVTYSGNADHGTITVTEYPGSTSCTLDGAVQSATSAGNPVQASITTTNASDLVIGAAHANWGSGGGGAGVGFTESTGSIGIHTQYRSTTAVGTYTPSTNPNLAGGVMIVAALVVHFGGTTTAGPSTMSGPSTRH